jgi:acyl-CoA thioester hydrolase
VRGRSWRPRSDRFLEETTEVAVRFHEVDSMGVVWHGHYIAYFEQARVAFGNRYGIDYMTILREGFVAPLIRVEVDHLRPVRFGDALDVSARLHPEPGARMVFTYRAALRGGPEVVRGLTWQAFTDLDGELMLTRPPFFESWLSRWAAEFRSE